MRFYNDIIAIPPGDTIKEELEFLKMSQNEFSKRLGMAEKTVSQIINGKAPITYETAIKLENVLDIPASTWNNLEAEYQECIARIEEEEKKEKEWILLQKFPYKEMIKKEWIKPSKDTFEIIKEFKIFFGVDSLAFIPNVQEEIFTYYENLDIRPLFKKTFNKEICEYSMTAWIRKGEIEAKKIETGIFNGINLKKTIPSIRELTINNSEESIEKLKKICANNGIALVILPHIGKTYVDGVSKWINKEKALIILSNRGKKLDKFWFNFFHELGHLLKHKKKELYINADETVGLEIEKEANEYARDILIPKKKYDDFKYLEINLENVRQFSKEIKIHHSIVVGRLQYDRLLSYNSSLNLLKEDIKI